MLLYYFSLQLLRQDLPWNLELMDTARLVGQQSPPVSTSTLLGF